MYVFYNYPSIDKLMVSLASQISAQLTKALSLKKNVTFAVSGGLTPKPLFQALSMIDLEWNRVNIILTDERFVSESDERSNAKLIREHLLQNFAEKAPFLSFCSSLTSPADVAATLSKRLKRVLPIDVCVLGMGTDMHTASIFPDADRLEDALNMYSNYILLPIISPSIPEARLTLTARILLQSSNLHLLVTGLSKKTALQKALEAPSEKVAPVRSVLLNNSETSIHYAA